LEPGRPIQAVPGTGLKVPLWILGSSLYGAQVAAFLGLPYAFASHFAPAALHDALAIYRERFQPSSQLAKPYAMPCINVILADTDDEARYLFTSMQQRFTDMVRNQRGLLPAPIQDINDYWTDAERMHVERMLTCSFVGSPATVEPLLSQFLDRTQADELIVSAAVFDQPARLRSYELLATLATRLGSQINESITA